MLDSHLNVGDHIDYVIASGAQSMYALKMLKSYEMSKVELSNLCRATLISKLIYASPSWWGFVSNAHNARLASLVSKAIKWGLYDQFMPSISEICEKADETLFRSAMNNAEHVLHQFLPPRQTRKYALRARPHDRQLTIANKLQSKSFLIRMLNEVTY